MLNTICTESRVLTPAEVDIRVHGYVKGATLASFYRGLAARAHNPAVKEALHAAATSPYDLWTAPAVRAMVKSIDYVVEQGVIFDTPAIEEAQDLSLLTEAERFYQKFV